MGGGGRGGGGCSENLGALWVPPVCRAYLSPLATALSHVSVQSIVNLQHFSCTGCIEARVLWRNAEALSRVSVQSTPTVPNLPPSSPPTSLQVLELPLHCTPWVHVAKISTVLGIQLRIHTVYIHLVRLLCSLGFL